jgi:hypothetical protein
MPEESKSKVERKQYDKPILVRHGSVAGLTKAYLLRAKVVGDKDVARSTHG